MIATRVKYRARAEPQFYLERARPFRKVAFTLVVGVLVLILVSELSLGMFPFFEFSIAAAVVYFIARR